MALNSDEALTALADALAALGITPADAESVLTAAEHYGDIRADEARSE